ncbi:MAG: NUDIX domain-containing protein [Candidatus Saccharibacteria bacterium]
MELFDEVDKNDNVIGTTNKVDSHKTSKIHRIVAIYVFDKNGLLYVQIHKTSGGLYDNSIGGHVAKGESYDEAAIREAKEELGIVQKLNKISVFYSDETPTIKHMICLYECVVADDWRFVPNDEVEEIVPMEVNVIKKMMNTNRELFTGGFVNTMKEYLRIKN